MQNRKSGVHSLFECGAPLEELVPEHLSELTEVREVAEGLVMNDDDETTHANVALIYHSDEYRFSIGYTTNTVTDNHITYQPDTEMLVDIRGYLVVQNNLTICCFI
jgi:hypothetical protein